ncbi:MAG: threonine dehydratase [Verrucomicrobia bacterium]|nr:MAG: threonine dehydratase [Verrucomicrobiota bacterium]
MNAPPLPGLADIEAAAREIEAVVPPTPQYSWPLLNERAGAEVWVKHENHTPIGSFKIRGAFWHLGRLVRERPDLPGFIAATRGNFGQAVAWAAGRLKRPAVIVVPHGNSREKNAAMRALGAELVEHGADFQAALEHASALAAQRGLRFVDSFHRDLAWGHAVSMLRFFRETPPLERLYVPIGLGSGICGAMAARDALGLPTRIIGVAAARAPAIALSFAERRLITHPATTELADGMACSTPHPEALAHMLRGVERIVTVDEEEIAAAIRAFFTDTHNVAEGAAAGALAALLKEKAGLAGRRVGVVLSGGNVDREVFARVLAG